MTEEERLKWERQKKLNESLEDSYRDKQGERSGTLEKHEGTSGGAAGGYSSENLRRKRFRWGEYKHFFLG